MVAVVAGRALMAAGARLLGPQAAKSAGGQALKKGAIDVFGGTQSGKRAALNLEESKKYLKRIMKHAEAASPLLKQQMMIYKKSWQLMWRPLGDAMGKLFRPFFIAFFKFSTFFYRFASLMLRPVERISTFLSKVLGFFDRFLRPLSRWMIRFAISWSRIFGGTAAKKSTESLEDRLSLLQSQLESAEMGGDAAAQNRIQAQIDLILAQLVGATANTKEFTAAQEDAFGELISNIFNLTLTFTKMGDTISSIVNNLVKETVKDVTSSKDDAYDKRSTGIAGVFEALSDFALKIKEWAEKLWAEYIVPGWTAVKDWAKNIWDQYISPAFEPVRAWGSKLWNIVKGPFEDLKGIIIGWIETITGIKHIKPVGSQDVIDAIEGKQTKARRREIEEIGFGGAREGWQVEGGIAGVVKASSQAINQYIDMVKSGVMSRLPAINTGMPSITGSSLFSSNAYTKQYKDFQKWQMTEAPRYENPLSRATGGSIDQTGLYNLHAGERVMNAGDASRMNMGSVNNFSNKFIINNPRISSNMDIRNLARELAKFQERELRRRVSYV